MAKPLRETMPTVAAWIDDLRDTFGAEGINAMIARTTSKGLPGFHAEENGQTVGIKSNPRGTWVHSGQMVLDTKKYETKRSRF